MKYFFIFMILFFSFELNAGYKLEYSLLQYSDNDTITDNISIFSQKDAFRIDMFSISIIVDYKDSIFMILYHDIESFVNLPFENKDMIFKNFFEIPMDEDSILIETKRKDKKDFIEYLIYCNGELVNGVYIDKTKKNDEFIRDFEILGMIFDSYKTLGESIIKEGIVSRIENYHAGIKLSEFKLKEMLVNKDYSLMMKPPAGYTQE